MPRCAEQGGRAMNFWKRHIGDYARDTGHLTLLEHGVYSVLLDRLYATERPIPEGDVYRIARAMSRSERAAVDAVLAEFFELEAGGWTNPRAMLEIEAAQSKATANRENGKSGGRPAKADGPKKPTAPTCPQQEIIAAYHEILPELPPVNDWPDSSADSLRKQWRKAKDRQEIQWWRTFFTYIRTCPFLMGEKSDFQASLGWMVKPANFAKIVNGNYEERRR